MSNRFDVLYSRENNPWIWGVQCLTNSGALFGRDLSQELVLQSVRKGNMETGHDWLGGWDFLTRLVGPVS